MTSKSTALEYLICDMMRGPHVWSMSLSELQVFIYKAGVALHNVPHFLGEDQEVPESILRSVAEIDPSANEDFWGEWVTNFCDKLGQDLPPRNGDQPPVAAT